MPFFASLAWILTCQFVFRLILKGITKHFMQKKNQLISGLNVKGVKWSFLAQVVHRRLLLLPFGRLCGWFPRTPSCFLVLKGQDQLAGCDDFINILLTILSFGFQTNLSLARVTLDGILTVLITKDYTRRHGAECTWYGLIICVNMNIYEYGINYWIQYNYIIFSAHSPTVSICSWW